MNKTINRLKELEFMLQDPNHDADAMVSRITDLLAILPKLLVVVEAGRGLRRAFRDNAYGDPVQITVLGRPAVRAWDDAIDALEEEV
jgi:hypothetical protein